MSSHLDPIRERHKARHEARFAAMSRIDYSKGRHRKTVLARDLTPGMVASRLAYSYLTDRPEYPTDVVISVEPSTMTFGGDDEFSNVWVPFKSADKETP